MSSAYVKQKLKQSREALVKKEWSVASDAASDVLEYEPTNYNANVFLGLAFLHQQKYDESEKAYRKATQDQPNQPLAWQGLDKFYSERQKWDDLGKVLVSLIDIYHESQEATKCAEIVQRYIKLEREQGGKRSLVDALSLLLPDSKYYPTLSLLDLPDQTNPEKTTTFDTQMAIHVNSLSVLNEMIQLTESLEASVIDKEAEKRRTRLDGARKGRDAIRNEIIVQVYSESKLPSLYEQVLAHPNAADELRKDTESKLLRFRMRLLTAYPTVSLNIPASTGTAAVDTAKEEEKVQEQLKLEQRKKTLRDEIKTMAEGMVIIGLEDELAWEILLEWKNLASLADLTLQSLRKFVSLFPRSGRSKSFEAFLLHIQDEQYLKELAEQEERNDIEVARPNEQDLLNLAIDGLEQCPNSILCHRIAASLYLLDRDFSSASDVATSALNLTRKIENEAAVDLTCTKIGISTTLVTCLTHLNPLQNAAKASRLADSVLQHDANSIDTLLAKAYINQAVSRWQESKQRFIQVQQVASSIDFDNSYKHKIERALSITKDPALQAWIEIAWCNVKLGLLLEAKKQMEEILEKIDLLSFDGVTSEDRAKVWFRLGLCLWQMDGEYRHDPSNSFSCFITSLKRNPAYAPSYTSLGIYYESVASPPDPVRASKCFQKAFELDASQNEAAKRLAEGFAEEREWDLVKVVARRTIQGESGAEALGADSSNASSTAVTASRRHLSQNSWAWNAIGNVEISRKSFEKAILAFQIALRSQPDDVGSWQRLGEAYSQAGRHVAALKCFAKCLELIESENQQRDVTNLDDGWQARYCTGDVYKQLGNFQQAIEIFEYILTDHPDELGVRMALSDTLLMAGRQQFHSGYLERAETSIRKAIGQAATVLARQDKYLRSAWKIAADACFQLSKFGRLQEPQKILGKSTASSSSRETEQDGLPGLYEVVAIAESLETDQKLPSVDTVTLKQVESSLEALVSKPSSSSNAPRPFHLLEVAVYLYKLRVVLNAADDKVAGSAWADLSVSLYRLSREMHASSSTTSGGQDEGAKAAKATRQSIACIKEALRHEPGNGAHWLLLGNLTFEKSVKLAQHCFIRAIESSPKSPIPWTHLGLLYLHHDDVLLANEAFMRAQTADPDYAEAWVGQALVASHHQDWRAAKALFEHAFKLSGGSLLEADYGLGHVVFDRFLASNDQDLNLFGSSSVLHSVSLALANYLAQRPSDIDALHLSALFSERLGQSALAIDRIEKAAALLESEYERTESITTARKYAVAETNLGRIRLQNGDHHGALEAFQATLGLLDDDNQGPTEEEGPNGTKDGWIDRQKMEITKIQACFASGVAFFFLSDEASAITWIQDALNRLDVLLSDATCASSGTDISTLQHAKTEIVVQLSRILWSLGDEEHRETARFLLLESIAATSDNIPAITTLAAIALVSSDHVLLDAAVSELESLVPTANTPSNSAAGSISSDVLAVPLLLAQVKLIRGTLNNDPNCTSQALDFLHSQIEYTQPNPSSSSTTAFSALHLNAILAFLETSIVHCPDPHTYPLQDLARKAIQIVDHPASIETEPLRDRVYRLAAQVFALNDENLYNRKKEAKSFAARAVVSAPWNSVNWSTLSHVSVGFSSS